MTRGYYSGAYLNQVDSKNRLSVPAAIRETVEGRSQARRIVLAPAEHAPCLVGYDETRFARIQEQLEARFEGDFGPSRDRFARTMFGMAETLGYDDNGRVILSAILKDLGELDGPALFLGAGDYFELWAPQRLLEQQDLDPRLVRTVKALLAARGVG
ncbi:division/cell wall cluster transcriptional repressor MraZ [Thermaurantiacus sp.]